MAPNNNRIDSTTPVGRTSVNVTGPRQTPDLFASKINNVSNAVSGGVNAAASFVSGGAIVSAAVSSVSNLSRPGSAMTASYSGFLPVGGPPSSSYPAGGPNNNLSPSVSQMLPNLPNYGNAQGGGLNQMNSQLQSSQQENFELLRVQIAMQRENQLFTTISNIEKTRHDTVKNSISNIR